MPTNDYARNDALKLCTVSEKIIYSLPLPIQPCLQTTFARATTKGNAKGQIRGCTVPRRHPGLAIRPGLCSIKKERRAMLHELSRRLLFHLSLSLEETSGKLKNLAFSDERNYQRSLRTSLCCFPFLFLSFFVPLSSLSGEEQRKKKKRGIIILFVRAEP